MYQPSTIKMRAFVTLAVYCRNRPQPQDSETSYLGSAEFREKLNEIGSNDNARRLLTISLLKHMALDPLVGTRVEDFLRVDASPGEGLFVCLRFHTVANPIDSFHVEAGSAEFAELVQAVQANLDSRMFKAARVYRRVTELNNRLAQQVSARATAAYERVKDAALSNKPPQYVGNRVLNPELQKYFVETAAAADAAFDAGYNAATQRNRRRVQIVAKEAFSPDFRGDGTAMLTAFAKRYLCPVTSPAQ